MVKGLKIGTKVTVTEYRAGNEIFHSLHGTIYKTYVNSACIILAPIDAMPIVTILGNDRIVASYKKIAEVAETIGLDPANAVGVERRIITAWRRGETVDQIKSDVLRSKSTVYRILDKYGFDLSKEGQNNRPKRPRPFTISRYIK